jgi:hypothetical protein
VHIREVGGHENGGETPGTSRVIVTMRTVVPNIYIHEITGAFPLKTKHRVNSAGLFL